MLKHNILTCNDLTVGISRFGSRLHGAFSRYARVFANCLALMALVIVVGCATGKSNGVNPENAAATQPQPFYLGADISGLTQVENGGGVYMDGDKPGDPLAIFMRNGWTCFRLRIWVNPRNGINGLAYTTKLAKRIKDAGATFMLDFHYSDWWADPQKQNKPAAWAKLDFDALVKQMQDYTSNVVKTLKDAGATPDFVQIGNEITGGTLWPDAQVKVPVSTVKVYDGDVQVIKPPEPYDDAKQWDHLIRVLKAASAGVRSATTPADHVRIIVHIDCGGDWPVTKWYFDHLMANQVDFDIIGQSYYPDYHGTLDNLRDNLRESINAYHKDVMVVETAYDTRGRPRSAGAAKNQVWTLTPEGQKQFLADLIRTVKDAPEGRGIGVNYWAPEGTYSTNAVAGRRGRGPGPRSLFDNRGYPLPAMYVLGLQPMPPTPPPPAPVAAPDVAPQSPAPSTNATVMPAIPPAATINTNN
jgi:arabinogalactan endo-1,4-beta-galactosidase